MPTFVNYHVREIALRNLNMMVSGFKPILPHLLGWFSSASQLVSWESRKESDATLWPIGGHGRGDGNGHTKALCGRDDRERERERELGKGGHVKEAK